MLFGLLHCVDRKTPTEKALGFYDILQDGGMAFHSRVCGNDRDIKPNFTKLCLFVTKDLFEFSSVKPIYDEEEVQLLEDAIVEVLEDDDEGWLTAVYDTKGSLRNEAWVEKVTKEGKWVFDATALRARVFR